jgi:hypothetical protein
MRNQKLNAVSDVKGIKRKFVFRFLAPNFKSYRSSLQAIQSAVAERAYFPQQNVCKTEKVLVDCSPAVSHLQPGPGIVMTYSFSFSLFLSSHKKIVENWKWKLMRNRKRNKLDEALALYAVNFDPAF